MKIHYLSNSSISQHSANLVHVAKMSSAFCALGHEVRLFVSHADGSCDLNLEQEYDLQAKPTIHVHRRAQGRLGQFLYGYRVRRAFKRIALPDVFYARNPIALAMVAKFGVPFVYEAHAIPTSKARRYLERKLLKHRQCLGIVCITQALLQDIRDAYPEAKELPALVAADGADLPKNLIEQHVDLVGRSGALKAGYVGSLYPGKGVEQIAELAVNMPDVDFHIIGGQGELLEDWRKRASADNLYFHGHVEHGALGAYYRAFDVALAPVQRRVLLGGGKADIARWTSPLKIFEYMAHGLPIIASDLPVLREVLNHGSNALLCACDDLGEWKETLSLLKNKSLRKTLSDQAFSDLSAHFSWTARAERIIDFLSWAGEQKKNGLTQTIY